MLTSTQRDKLKNIFNHRAKMKTINSFLSLQEPAGPEQILELRRLSDNDYFFVPVMPERKVNIPKPHGRFLFVIPSFSPGKVFCGVPKGYRTFASDIIKPIQGHTSICLDKDVFFAGEVDFINGVLKSWSNNSGHYMPKAELIDINFIPAVKLLLPKSKFNEIF